MIMNLRYADDIILLATSEAELQELVDRLDRVSRKYSLLINVDKTKVMASDGITCHILIQNELLKQVDTFPYLGSLITEDGECTTEFRTRKHAIEASLQKIWKSHSIPISTKIRLMKELVWPVATYGCESWTLRKNEETYVELDAFEMKGLRRILPVSWTAKKTNEWKLAYYGHTMRKQVSCLEKEIMQGTMPGARRRVSRTAWMDNIKTWTGLSVEESIRMTAEDRDKWRKYVHGVANPRIEDG